MEMHESKMQIYSFHFLENFISKAWHLSSWKKKKKFARKVHMFF